MNKETKLWLNNQTNKYIHKWFKQHTYQEMNKYMNEDKIDNRK